ncbi:MAG: hypothetical protein AABX08_02215 [Nanoarchaeota archaeon]
MDWKECCDKKIAKNVKLDENLINSLKKTSENKLKSSEELIMNEINAASKVPLAYDSLRELLEALSLKKGYKIYNHECYTAFLKEIIGESEKGEEFDKIRIERNAINYYAKEISLEEAKDLIDKIKHLRNQVLNLLNN